MTALMLHNYIVAIKNALCILIMVNKNQIFSFISICVSYLENFCLLIKTVELKWLKLQNAFAVTMGGEMNNV